MTQETGHNELSRLSALLEQLNRYEAELQSPALDYEKDEEVDKFLYPKKDWLRSLSAEDCNIGSILLEGHAHHLQRAVNRCKSIMKWAEECLGLVVAEQASKEKGYKYEERRALAIRTLVAENKPTAMKLEQLRVDYQTRYYSFEYLPTKFEKQADFYKELAQTKRKSHG